MSVKFIISFHNIISDDYKKAREKCKKAEKSLQRNVAQLDLESQSQSQSVTITISRKYDE